jgi:hypothetical protein
MNVKTEELVQHPIANLDRNVQKVLEVLPAEHLRGLNKIVFVDQVAEPRISAAQRSALPALYHPRMGGQQAWAEVALSVVAPKKKFPKNLFYKLTLKSNIAQVVLSLVAQHYHLTLAKGVKKSQLEVACRLYVERYFEKWRERQGGWRVRLLKPFKPQLDRWARRLAKRYRQELDKKKNTR